MISSHTWITAIAGHPSSQAQTAEARACFEPPSCFQRDTLSPLNRSTAELYILVLGHNMNYRRVSPLDKLGVVLFRTGSRAGTLKRMPQAEGSRLGRVSRSPRSFELDQELQYLIPTNR